MTTQEKVSSIINDGLGELEGKIIKERVIKELKEADFGITLERYKNIEEDNE